MTDQELTNGMTVILRDLQKHPDDEKMKESIARAVTLGMRYQENKIREGINIVFDELNKKIKTYK